MGRMDESLAESIRALELDPLDLENKNSSRLALLFRA
jgi:hypothetical protein